MNVRTSGCALGLLIAVPACGRGAANDGDVAPAEVAPLTAAQVQSARAAGLIPSGYLEPTFLEPVAGFPFTADGVTSNALRINDSGTVVGFTQIYCAPASAAGGCPAAPFFADPSGQQHLLPSPSGASAYIADINQSGDMLGYGGPGGAADFLRPVVYHPDGSYELLPMPTPPWGSTPVRMWAPAANDVYGAATAPGVIGTAIYLHGGTLALWHLDGNGTDAMGPSQLTLPANPEWVAGHRGSALHLDGSFCPTAPAASDTWYYSGPGVTMMAWVRPDASMCPGGGGAIVGRLQELALSLGCDANGTAATVAGHVLGGGGATAVMPPVGHIPFGQWSHVALTSDYRTIRAYVDGVQVGEQRGGTPGPAVSQISVGCGFHGAVDEVSLFDVPMGPAEIDLFRRDRMGYVPSDVHHLWGRVADGFFSVVLAPSDPPYTPSGVASDMNDQGQVVGYLSLADGSTSAMLYDPASGWQNLNGLLPADSGWNLGNASTITNAGLVLGTGEHNGRHATYRLDLNTGAIVDVAHDAEPPYDNPAFYVFSYGVNANGHVAGAIYDEWPFWPHRAFVYTNELGLTDLNSLIDPASRWTLREARGINDRDEIVGVAQNDAGQWRGFKLNLAPLIAQYTPVMPTLACVGDLGQGRLEAAFGYLSTAASTVFTAYCSGNQLSDAGGPIPSPASFPPQLFTPGQTQVAFTTAFDASGSVTWTLGRSAVTASAASPRCPTTPAGTPDTGTSDPAVLGFESAAAWSVSGGGSSLAFDHTEGAYSFAVAPAGRTEIVSRRISTLPSVGSAFEIDVSVPTPQPPGTPSGTLRLYVDLPSQGLNDVNVGEADLDALPLNTFKTVRFPISTNLASRLRGTYTDLSFRLVLDVQPNTGLFRFDRLRADFDRGVITPSLSCVRQTGTRYTAVFGYQNASAAPVILPVGLENQLLTGAGTPQQRQPTQFLPGGQSEAFSVDFDGLPLQWRLGARTVDASASSPPCAAVACSP